jgi:S-formylglutathione hydrolase FrmB
MVGLEPAAYFSVTVKDIAPGQPITIDDKAVSYPATLSNIERGDYYVQAVWDRNLGGRSIAESEGNLYTDAQKITLTKDYNASFTLVADKINPAPTFKETAFDKELKAPSKLLTDFHQKNITVNAAVILPAEYYKDNTTKFPVLFIASGYGGDYHRFSGDTLPSNPIDSVPVIWVFLDGNCPLGHSVYANSDNNGPWGDALTKEFIPALEKQYRCNGARLLQGHSSGGWTVLWLQTHYPEVFAGCASSAPDPVDFRNFQQINLYEDKNFYYGKDSTLNLVATVAGRFPWAYMKTICQAENVVYRGEQMHSFDAVFSAKGNDGNPRRICDAATGVIDSITFSHWKNYDISWYVRSNWDKIKNNLDGKIRVSVGNQDNFLLNHSVKLLEAEMKN